MTTSAVGMATRCMGMAPVCKSDSWEAETIDSMIPAHVAGRERSRPAFGDHQDLCIALTSDVVVGPEADCSSIHFGGTTYLYLPSADSHT
eukprot:5526496-Prymnesium_polylepis.1